MTVLKDQNRAYLSDFLLKKYNKVYEIKTSIINTDRIVPLFEPENWQHVH